MAPCPTLLTTYHSLLTQRRVGIHPTRPVGRNERRGQRYDHEHRGRRRKHVHVPHAHAVQLTLENSARESVVGLAGAAGLTRLLQSLLYDTAAMDPLTFGTMALVLFGVGLLASYLPARRASSIDPIEAIRAD